MTGIVCVKSIDVPVLFKISIESDIANENFNFLLGFGSSGSIHQLGVLLVCTISTPLMKLREQVQLFTKIFII